jgi:ATP-binding cassette subfamily B protein
LRKRITSLTQDTFLFRDTLAENIAFGKPKATMEEIVEAARKAGADKFIRKFPDGYDTLVGEGGATLSGGQRQRISFARAALRDCPVMIFDEPATGLDIHAEKEAKEALGNMKHDHTICIITHRLNFLDLADWAIYIRDGRLMEQGDPRELFEKKAGFYEFVYSEANRAGDSEWPGDIIFKDPEC